jgi:uncharacterized Zn finger protein
MGRTYDSDFPRYVPVAERRRRAAKKIASMQKAGRDISPVAITGRKIAATFWGEAWCNNLEAYSDYESRLPRGRTYVRNGSVLDLQIDAGRVRTLVSGTELYTVDIAIKSLAKQRWGEIKARCAGQLDSLVELLQGSISKSVMEIVTRKGEGLFPSPGEITLDCSCPDWATMCKHVAAALYGVGARLDHRPELLFTLRGVDPTEMVEAAVDQPARRGKARRGRVLETDELSSVFGVDIDMTGASSVEVPTSIKPKGSARRASKARNLTASTAGRTTRTQPARRNAPAVKSTARQPAAKKKSATTPVRRNAAAVKGTARQPAAKKKSATTPARRNAAAVKGTARQPAAKKKSATTRGTSEAAAATDTATRKTTKKSAPARKGPVRKPRAMTSSVKKSTVEKADPKQTTAKKYTAKKAASKRTPIAKKTTGKTQR